jgi:hypothetical protein
MWIILQLNTEIYDHKCITSETFIHFYQFLCFFVYFLYCIYVLSALNAETNSK